MGHNRDVPDRDRRLRIARRLTDAGLTFRDAREEYPDLWTNTSAGERRWYRDVIDSRKPPPSKPPPRGAVFRRVLHAIAREVGPLHLPTAARVVGCTLSGARKIMLLMHARRVYRLSHGGWVWVLPGTSPDEYDVPGAGLAPP
jgi:hypothetical protein